MSNENPEISTVHNEHGASVVNHGVDDEAAQNDDVKKPQHTTMSSRAPDGGWGWVILFAVFMGNVIIDGVVGCFGIFYPALLEAFGASPAITSIAGSMIVGVYMTSAPAIGILIRRFGCRLVSFVGAIIAAVGFVIATWSENIIVFMVSYGILGGIGIGMNSLCGHLIVNLYFNKRRGLAGGIVSSGAGFGVFAMAPFTQKMIEIFTWRGGLLIIGGIILQFCVFAMLMRPLDSGQHRESDQDYIDSHTTSISSAEVAHEDSKNVAQTDHLLPDVAHHSSVRHSVLSLDPKIKQTHLFDTVYSSHRNINHSSEDIEVSNLYSLPDLSQMHDKQFVPKSKLRHRGHNSRQEKPPREQFDPLARKDIFYSGSLHQLMEFRQADSVDSFIQSMIIDDGYHGPDDVGERHVTSQKEGLCNWSVFRNPVYIPMLIGGSLIQMGQFIPSTFLPEYCYTVGLTPQDASIVISLYGALNIAGRLSAGCLANLRTVNPLLLCCFGMLMSAICCALFPLCTTFTTLCLYSCSFGYFIGYFPPLQVLALVRYLGLHRLTAAMGFIQLAKGPAALIGPPLAGIIYEWTRDYAMCMVFAAVVFLLSAIIPSLVPIIDTARKKREPGQDVEMIVSDSSSN